MEKIANEITDNMREEPKQRILRGMGQILFIC